MVLCLTHDRGWWLFEPQTSQMFEVKRNLPVDIESSTPYEILDNSNTVLGAERIMFMWL
jgi:hypothetical protein